MLEVLSILLANARSDRIIEILNYLIQNSQRLDKIHIDKAYKDLTKNHINWG